MIRVRGKKNLFEGDYDKMDDDNERYVDGKKRLLMHYNEDSDETCR